MKIQSDSVHFYRNIETLKNSCRSLVTSLITYFLVTQYKSATSQADQVKLKNLLSHIFINIVKNKYFFKLKKKKKIQVCQNY